VITELEISALDTIKKHIIGKVVPDRFYGEAGYKVEELIEELGFPWNKNKGCDIPIFNWEGKTRDLSARSSITIAKMTKEDILETPYKKSNVRNKAQKILLISTQNNIIVDVRLHDLTPNHAQQFIEKSYNIAKEQLSNYVPTTKNPYLDRTKYKSPNCGYFECQDKKGDSYSFRYNNKAFKDLTNSANMFPTLFNQ